MSSTIQPAELKEVVVVGANSGLLDVPTNHPPGPGPAIAPRRYREGTYQRSGGIRIPSLQDQLFVSGFFASGLNPRSPLAFTESGREMDIKTGVLKDDEFCHYMQTLLVTLRNEQGPRQHGQSANDTHDLISRIYSDIFLAFQPHSGNMNGGWDRNAHGAKAAIKTNFGFSSRNKNNNTNKPAYNPLGRVFLPYPYLRDLDPFETVRVVEYLDPLGVRDRCLPTLRALAAYFQNPTKDNLRGRAVFFTMSLETKNCCLLQILILFSSLRLKFKTDEVFRECSRDLGGHPEPEAGDRISNFLSFLDESEYCNLLSPPDALLSRPGSLFWPEDPIQNYYGRAHLENPKAARAQISPKPFLLYGRPQQDGESFWTSLYIHTRQGYEFGIIPTHINLDTWLQNLKLKGYSIPGRLSGTNYSDLITIQMMVTDQGDQIEKSITDFSYPFRHFITTLLKHDARVLQKAVAYMHSIMSTPPKDIESEKIHYMHETSKLLLALTMYHENYHSLKTLSQTKGWGSLLADLDSRLQSMDKQVGLCILTAERLRNHLVNMITVSETRQMKRLSILAAIFIPLSFMGTFFGMNVAEILDGKPTLGVFFASSVPLTILAVALTSFWEPFWESLFHSWDLILRGLVNSWELTPWKRSYEFLEDLSWIKKCLGLVRYILLGILMCLALLWHIVGLLVGFLWRYIILDRTRRWRLRNM